ncbi:MAG: YlxR family protein [Clostridia bacterium]|nr:YlxR family protein [Clostridia bacterium]
MAPIKRVPLRKCTGCGEMKPKNQLVRVVKSPEGELSLDLTGKKSGRGAYVCTDPACLASARKARRLEKAFACRVPDALYEELEAYAQHANE